MSILPKMSSCLDEHYECIMFATQYSRKKRLQKNNGISSVTVNYVCFSYYSTSEVQQLFFSFLLT